MATVTCANHASKLPVKKLVQPMNEKSHQLKVEFDTEKTSITKIEESILKAGYDTEKIKATDKAYKSLPTCCQYERE